MENTNQPVQPKRKVTGMSVEVMRRMPMFQKNPQLLNQIIEEYQTAPRLKHTVFQIQFTKEHLEAAQAWSTKKITADEFLKFCGQPTVPGRPAYLNERAADNTFNKIVKAKMRGEIA